MSIVINGSGTITGINAGGLPAASVTQATLAANVAGNGPAFSAYLNTTQAIAHATFTKVQINTEEFDTNSNFNNTASVVGSTPAYAFLPTIAGYYSITGSSSFGSSTVGVTLVTLFKNGSRFKDGPVSAYSAYGVASTVAGLIYLNGSTDYVELYAYQTSGASQNLVGVSYSTYFQASLVRAA